MLKSHHGSIELKENGIVLLEQLIRVLIGEGDHVVIVGDLRKGKR